MNLILLITDKTIKKEYRFLNPLTEAEVRDAFIPENCRLIKEGELPFKEIFDIPIINDGLSPLAFDTSEAFIEFSPDKRAGNLLLAAALLVEGFCQSVIKRRKSESLEKIKSSLLKVAALQERTELLREKSMVHNILLTAFLNEERNRENPFVASEKMMSDLENVKKSKDELISIVSDIEKILGNRELLILSDFKSP